MSALNPAVTGDGDDSTTAPRYLLPAFGTSDHNEDREEILLSPKRSSSSEKSVVEILSTPKIQRKNLVRKSLNSKSVVLKRDLLLQFEATKTKGKTEIKPKQQANPSKKFHKKEKGTNVKQRQEKDVFCGDCGVFYHEQKDNRNWIQCVECKIWFHEKCESGKCVSVGGLCQECEDGCAMLDDE